MVDGFGLCFLLLHWVYERTPRVQHIYRAKLNPTVHGALCISEEKSFCSVHASKIDGVVLINKCYTESSVSLGVDRTSEQARISNALVTWIVALAIFYRVPNRYKTTARRSITFMYLRLPQHCESYNSPQALTKFWGLSAWGLQILRAPGVGFVNRLQLLGSWVIISGVFKWGNYSSNPYWGTYNPSYQNYP